MVIFEFDNQGQYETNQGLNNAYLFDKGLVVIIFTAKFCAFNFIIFKKSVVFIFVIRLLSLVRCSE